MKKLPLLRIRFSGNFLPEEIPAVRAAFAKKVPGENTLFHHHLADNKVLYKYPLIQFKPISSGLMVVCLDKGADEFRKFLDLSDWTINIKRKAVSLEVSDLQLKRFPLQVWDKRFDYRINSWIALNQKNYEKYFSSVSLVEKIVLLEKSLTAHILSFAEGVGWNVDQRLEVSIAEIHKVHWRIYKGVRFFAPDITFSTNATLPPMIGLGKAASVGFGTLSPIRNKFKENPGQIIHEFAE